MAEGYEDEEVFGESLREKLGATARDIEWTYAIFWSISSSQTGVLEWGDGYYNGDIKTRKTVQATEISTDLLGLQRTDQLRELYESLLAGEAKPQPKMHSVALSPEDLTDTEWYFLVCMSFSFIFNIGQGLPGRALEKKQSIWLCNADQADSRIFTRSLLAKSASIQTVVCFPHLGGVIELGTTDFVQEDLGLIHRIRTSYLDGPHIIISKVLPNINPFSPPPECADNNDIGSSYKHSNDSFMVEDINGEASQLQNRKFADDDDDDVSNCIYNHSGNSSDCISQNYINGHSEQQQQQQGIIDVHYQSVLSNVLQNSHQFILGPNSRSRSSVSDRYSSSFVNWKKTSSTKTISAPPGPPQRILKKILLDVARMHGCSFRECHRENEIISGPRADLTGRSRAALESRRREKLNERFMILASLIPATCKGDKISILDETIGYLKELERRCREVESQKDSRTRGGVSDDGDDDNDDDMDKTYDHKCGSNRADKGNSLSQKGKNEDDMEKCPHDNYNGFAKNGLAHGVKISVNEDNVMIEMRCAWSEGMLVKIIEALNHLHLVCHEIQSSNTDGILYATIKAKMEELKATSTGVITQTLLGLT
ncbi:unnamed protein product [Cuscuta europaea]|uniref:BHLH domain-containing protein n=1 Tax=Cuscuta europaea TaxID=41803 RepID=A0A9P0ZGB2_CUSEU|nr:unnamed protein product [Cuscuta europaea]